MTSNGPISVFQSQIDTTDKQISELKAISKKEQIITPNSFRGLFEAEKWMLKQVQRDAKAFWDAF